MRFGLARQLDQGAHHYASFLSSRNALGVVSPSRITPPAWVPAPSIQSHYILLRLVPLP